MKLNETTISNRLLLDIINIQTEVVEQGTDLSNIMQHITQRAQQITQAEGACVELIHNQQLVYSAASGMANPFLGLRLNMENSLSGYCIDSKIPLISNDIEIDDRVNKVACRRIGLRSMIVVPLIFLDNVVGVLKVLSNKENHFSDENIEVLKLISKVIAAAMYSAMQNDENELYYKATHDFLTNISNRSVFYDRLRQKLAQSDRTKEKFGIVLADMDKLKEVNDNYGHRAGDAAIKEVASRMKEVIRESDTLSRLGGDEFALILSKISSCDEMNRFADRLRNEINQPFVFEGHDIPLQISIGYTIYEEDGIELETLIEKADAKMYEEKRQHKAK